MNPYQMLSTGNQVMHYAQQAIKMVPMVYLQIVFLSLWILLFVYVKKLLKQKNRLLIAILCCLLCFTGVLLAFKNIIQKRVYLKTNHDNCALYSGPDKTFTVLCHLPAGEELSKLKTVGNFQKARWHGTIVWIDTHDVTEIPPTH